jgi:hypothetical protein
MCGTRKSKNIIVPDVASKNFCPIELSIKPIFFIPKTFSFLSPSSQQSKPISPLLKIPKTEEFFPLSYSRKKKRKLVAGNKAH